MTPEDPYVAKLRERILTTRKEISCAESKRVGISEAIEIRKRSLARLEAQLVLCGGFGQARALEPCQR